MDWSAVTKKAQSELDRAQRRGRGGLRRWSGSGRNAIRVFTTRPDTLFGATYMVLAPEHPMVDALTTRSPARQPCDAYRQGVSKQGLVERQKVDKRKKSGVVHRQPMRESGERRGNPGVDRRLRAHGLRHRRHHGRAGPRRHGISSSLEEFDLAHQARHRGESGGRRRHAARRRRSPATARWSIPVPSTACQRTNRRRPAIVAALCRETGLGRRAHGCSIACTTGACRGSATGGRRSPWCIASACGVVPVPEAKTCPS